jgi:hypothetical protein
MEVTTSVNEEQKRWRGWPIVVVTLAGIVIGVRTVVGLIWQGHHPVWRPDSAFYLLISLRIDGVDSATAEHAVQSYFVSIGERFKGPMTLEPNYPLFLGRPLYPLLSAPLVAIFGYYGMFIVPFAAYLTVPALLFRALKKLVPSWYAVAGAVLFLLATPSKWLLGPLAEPIAIALMAGWFCTLPWQGARSNRTLALGFVLLLFGGMTRPIVFAVLVPMALLALWARRHQRDRYRDWLKALGTSTAAMVLTTGVSQLLAGVGPLYVAYKSTRVADPVQALIHYPLQLLSQIGLELWSLLQDVPTMLFLAIAVAGAIIGRQRIVRWLLSGAVLSYLTTLVLVPYFTEERLFLPSLIFLVAAALVTLVDVADHLKSQPERELAEAS